MRRYLIVLVLSVVGLACVPGTVEAQRIAVRGGSYAGVGPLGGVGVGGSRTAVAAGPFGASAVHRQGGTFVTPGGSVVQHGSVGGVATGSFGGTTAGRVSGTRVTTPYGQTYSNVSRSGVAAGPFGGVAAGRTSTTAVSGPFGAGVVRRTGVGVWP